MNKTIEKLKEKFLPEPKFEYETCEEECKHCCHENLGCTIWKEKIEDIRDKVKKVQNLEKQSKNLQEELGLVDEEARPKIKEKLEKISKQIEEEKTKITNSKPKVIIIRLKKDTNNETCLFGVASLSTRASWRKIWNANSRKFFFVL